MDNFILSYDDDNDILYLKILGSIEREDLQKLTSRFNELFEGKPRRYVLTDMSESITLDSKVMTKQMRETYREFSDLLNADRSAIVGASPSMRMVAKIVLAITGRSKDTKFFNAKEEALSWLKGEIK